MNDLKNVDDYRWLTGEAGCMAVADAVADDRPLHTLLCDLRKELSPQQAHLVLEQRELRVRARKKFDYASEMLFTKRSLEQATDQWIAAYKASRFPAGSSTADLCCGIGGDLLALATRGPATGVDCDPCIVELARANIHKLAKISGELAGGPSGIEPPTYYDSQVLVSQADEFDVACVDAWHCDPDRRPQGRRTTRTELHSPNEETLGRLLSINSNSAIKLAPASNALSLWTENDRIEWEWISRGRECRQLVAWHGNLATNRGKHVATVVLTDGQPTRSFSGFPGEATAVRSTVGQFVYVPDPALFAARLDGALANIHGLERLGEAGTRLGGYLTGPHQVDEPLLDRFEVADVLPLDAKQIASLLHARNIGTLEIKHRGVDLEPDRFRRRLNLLGDLSATILATTIGNSAIAILAQRQDSR